MHSMKDYLANNPTIQRLKALSEGIEIEAREPACATCQDRGFVGAGVEREHPDFGKVFPCPNPDCAIKRANALARFERVKQLYSVDMDAAYRDYTFSTWRDALTEAQKAGKLLPYLAAVHFAGKAGHVFSLVDVLKGAKLPFKQEGVDEDGVDWITATLRGKEERFQNSVGSWLAFQGDYGSGKTGLGIATLNRLQQRGVFAIYIHLPTFLDLYQSTYRYEDHEEQRQAQERLTKPLLDALVLLVDEMNVAEKGGAASEDKVRIVLNHIIQPRWVAGHARPTLITTNLSADAFEKHWGQRIASRVFERAHWLRLTGVPLRQKNRPL